MWGMGTGRMLEVGRKSGAGRMLKVDGVMKRTQHRALLLDEEPSLGDGSFK